MGGERLGGSGLLNEELMRKRLLQLQSQNIGVPGDITNSLATLAGPSTPPFNPKIPQRNQATFSGPTMNSTRPVGSPQPPQRVGGSTNSRARRQGRTPLPQSVSSLFPTLTGSNPSQKGSSLSASIPAGVNPFITNRKLAL